MRIIKDRERNLKNALIEASSDIRQKYKALKSGLQEHNIAYEQVHKPLLDPIKAIVDTVKNKMAAVPRRKQSSLRSFSPIPTSSAYINSTTVEDEDGASDVAETEVAEPQPSTSVANLKTLFERRGKRKSERDDDEDSYLSSHRDIYSSSFHPLPKKYLNLLRRDARDVDRSPFGVAFDRQTQKWHFGNTTIDILNKQKKLKVHGKRYEGTDGLYQLLTLKRPVGYTQKDLENYLRIIKSTHADRKGDPTSKRHGHSGFKYVNIIKPALDEQKKDGGGIFKKVLKKRVEYVFWNKASELVRRLRLLVASKSAGHTNHQNEITSILEELREEKIIQ